MSDINDYIPLWGEWQVESLIGEGSLGKVYKIRKEESGKVTYSALKMITITSDAIELLQKDGMDSALFQVHMHTHVKGIIEKLNLMSELRTTPHMVSFDDYMVVKNESGSGWDILIRMELLTSLAKLESEKPLSRDEVVKMGVHICYALELCATHNAVHGDIRPENIFISEIGDYKLGGFGIEQLDSEISKSDAGSYMAPEVLRGYAYDANADMYSLGLVLYRSLNRGRMPFWDDYPSPITPADQESALQRRTDGEMLPDIEGVDRALNNFVLKACDFDSMERFVNPGFMRKALEALAVESYAQAHAPAIESTATNVAKIDWTSQNLSEVEDNFFDAFGSPYRSHGSEGASGKKAVVSLKSPNKTMPESRVKSPPKTSSAIPETSPKTPPTTSHGTKPITSFEQTKKKWLAILLIATALIVVVLGALIIWQGRVSSPNVAGVTSTEQTYGPYNEPTIMYPQGLVDVGVAVGDIMRFGGYEWRVLYVQGGQALLLSELVLGHMPFYLAGFANEQEAFYYLDENENGNNLAESFVTTWEQSDIRHYLNNEFTAARFSDAERAQITRTRVGNYNNQWYDTPGGNDTEDYVFLLSFDEVVRYFGGDERLYSRLIDSYWLNDRYNSTRVAQNVAGSASWWWLRSPGIDQSAAARIGVAGGVGVGGYDVFRVGGVRPALWLNLQH